jgi:hypothetical protein
MAPQAHNNSQRNADILKMGMEGSPVWAIVEKHRLDETSCKTRQ